MGIGQKVKEFHQAFGLDVADKPQESLSKELRNLRWSLLEEELDELDSAEGEKDVVEIADAIGDAIYILAGTAVVYGIDIDSVLEEIHRSNMAKLGPDRKPIYREDGKVLKPEGWQPPRIKEVIG